MDTRSGRCVFWAIATASALPNARRGRSEDELPRPLEQRAVTRSSLRPARRLIHPALHPLRPALRPSHPGHRALHLRVRRNYRTKRRSADAGRLRTSPRGRRRSKPSGRTCNRPRSTMPLPADRSRRRIPFRAPCRRRPTFRRGTLPSCSRSESIPDSVHYNHSAEARPDTAGRMRPIHRPPALPAHPRRPHPGHRRSLRASRPMRSSRRRWIRRRRTSPQRRPGLLLHPPPAHFQDAASCRTRPPTLRAHKPGGKCARSPVRARDRHEKTLSSPAKLARSSGHRPSEVGPGCSSGPCVGARRLPRQIASCRRRRRKHPSRRPESYRFACQPG